VLSSSEFYSLLSEDSDLQVSFYVSLSSAFKDKSHSFVETRCSFSFSERLVFLNV